MNAKSKSSCHEFQSLREDIQTKKLFNSGIARIADKNDVLRVWRKKILMMIIIVAMIILIIILVILMITMTKNTETPTNIVNFG